MELAGYTLLFDGSSAAELTSSPVCADPIPVAECGHPWPHPPAFRVDGEWPPNVDVVPVRSSSRRFAARREALGRMPTDGLGLVEVSGAPDVVVLDPRHVVELHRSPGYPRRFDDECAECGHAVVAGVMPLFLSGAVHGWARLPFPIWGGPVSVVGAEVALALRGLRFPPKCALEGAYRPSPGDDAAALVEKWRHGRLTAARIDLDIR